MPIDWKALSAPFDDHEISWRGQTLSGRGDSALVLAYLTSRAVQDRLDRVVGPASWRNSYRAGPQGGIVCLLEIEVEPGVWVGKEDGADNTDIEATKGGLSGALKRAAVQWGIGRYLYELGDTWVRVQEGFPPRGQSDTITVQHKGKRYWGRRPQLPDWAKPTQHTPRKQGAIVEEAPAPADPDSAFVPEWVKNTSEGAKKRRHAVYKWLRPALNTSAGKFTYEQFRDYVLHRQKQQGKELKEPADYSDDAIQRMLAAIGIVKTNGVYEVLDDSSGWLSFVDFCEQRAAALAVE